MRHVNVATILGALSEFKHLALVFCAVGVGVWLPNFGSATKPLVTPLVIFVIFGSFREFRVTEINPLSSAGVVVLSLLMSYTVLPIGGMQIASLFLADGALIGFAIMLAVPTTAGSAIIWTRLSGSDDQLSILISVASLVLAPLVTPVVFRLLVRSRIQTPVETMVWDLLLIVGVGIAFTLLVPDGTVSKRTVDRGAGLAILLIIYSSVANLDLGSIDIGDVAPILLVTLFVLCGGLLLSIVVGYSLHLQRVSILPLFFTSSLKNLGIALFIALSYPSPLTVAAIVTYYAVQQMFGAIIVDFAPSWSPTRS